MTDTEPKVILECNFPAGVILPLERITVEKLTQLKGDLDYAMEVLVGLVRRLEDDGWKIYYSPDEITACKFDLRTKEAAQKRLDELDLSRWEGVFVE